MNEFQNPFSSSWIIYALGEANAHKYDMACIMGAGRMGEKIVERKSVRALAIVDGRRQKASEAEPQKATRDESVKNVHIEII